MIGALLSKVRSGLLTDGDNALFTRVMGSGLSAVIVKIAAAGLSYLMFVVLAKLMAENEYGAFAFGFNLGIILATVAGLGATTAIMRFWPQYEVNGQTELAHGALHAGALSTMLAAAACGLVIVAAAPAIASAASFDDSSSVMMAGLFGPAVAFSEYVAAALRAKGLVFWSLAPRDVFWRGGLTALAALFAWSSGTLDATQALFIATALLIAITTLQALFALRVFGMVHGRRTDWPTWRRASGAMWGAAVLYALVQQSDVVIAGFYLSSAETGSYFAAQKTAQLLTLFLVAGNLAGAPMISAYYHKRDYAGLSRLCGLLSLGISVPTVIGLFALGLFGRELLTIFDPTFSTAYPVLFVLAAAAAFDSLAGPTAYFLQMSGRESLYLKIMTCTYLGVVVLQLLLAPLWGALGIAIPTAIGVIVWNVVAVVILRGQTGVDPSIFGLFGRTKDQPA